MYIEFIEHFPILGEDQVIVIEQCSTSLCFNKEISYEAPMEQLQTLMTSSGPCKQEITFKCKLAPIKVNFAITFIILRKTHN